MISIIVAVAENNVIGKNNSLIWRLPNDMKFFKEKTINHCIITGRKNYESIPDKFRPLQNRTNIVISRQVDYSAPGAIVSGSLEEAVKQAKELCSDEIFIIGGAEIYNQSIDISDKIYLTQIYHAFDGDAYFPKLNFKQWKEIDRKKGTVDDKNLFAHDFITFSRIKEP